jgi:uncharacterized membrane protein
MTREEEMRRRRWYPWAGGRPPQHPAIRKMEDDRTLGERVADRIASFGGSWPFIFVFLGFIFFWMILNTLLLARVLHVHQFDGYPYIALNLMLSALAGLQAPVILMSQNRAAAKDEALAEHHYEESQKIEEILTNSKRLLDENTELTKQVRDLTVQIHGLVSAPGDSQPVPST